MDKEENTRKLKLVSMDEVDILSLDKPIIGTQALATCVGVLLYSEKHKRAIVAHVSSDYGNVLNNIIDMIFINDLIDDKIYYCIIPGFYKEHYNVVKGLTEFFEKYSDLFYPMSYDITRNCYRVDKDTNSKEFAFDSLKGIFVTNDVLFGEEYIKINNKYHK